MPTRIHLPEPDPEYANRWTIHLTLGRNRPKLSSASPSQDEADVGPPGLGAADDLEAGIVDFIAGARSKLIPQRAYRRSGKPLRSASYEQRPDVAIEIDRTEGPPRVLIFDPCPGARSSRKPRERGRTSTY